MFEGSSMLMVMLGVAIAFSVVMLLLSLLVTTLSQATQGLLKIRGRNLQSAIRSLFQSEFSLPKWAAKQHAAALLNSPQIALLKQRNNPDGLWGRFLGPVVSWVDADTLKAALGHVGEETPDAPKYSVLPETATRANVDHIVEQFKALDNPMRKRFATRMRGVSLFWAIVVALVFQVGTPDLLHRLSVDPELRASYIARADAALEHSLTVLAQKHGLIQEALVRLSQKYPQMQRDIERVQADVGLSAVLEDLSENLERYDGRPEAIDDFMAFVSENQSKQLEGNTRDLLNELSIIDIAPWRYGNAFYWKEGAVQVGNLMGVLLTVILLTLGAPFWYGALKKGVAFRDLLAPKEEEQKTTDANKLDANSSDGNN